MSYPHACYVNQMHECTRRLRVVFDMPCQLSHRHIANADSRNRLHAFQANAAIIFSNGEYRPCCRLGGAEPLIFCYTGNSTECCIEDGVSDILFLPSSLSRHYVHRHGLQPTAFTLVRPVITGLPLTAGAPESIPAPTRPPGRSALGFRNRKQPPSTRSHHTEDLQERRAGPVSRPALPPTSSW